MKITKVISILCIIAIITYIAGPVLVATDIGIENQQQEENEEKKEEQEDEIEETEENKETIPLKEENVVEGEEQKNETESQETEIQQNQLLQEKTIGSNKIKTKSLSSIEQTIEDGIYQIASALDQSKVIDIAGGSTKNSANVQIWNNDKVDQQKFKITYIGDGYYTLEAVHSGKVLDVAGGSKQNGANVQQYESNSTDAQKWIIKKTEDGYYNIISKKSGLYLDIAGASTANGTNVQQYTGNGTKAQKFVLKECVALKGEQTIEDGIYQIASALDQSKVIDIAGGSTKNSANVQIWNNDKVDQQKIKITYIGDGYYTLEALHSGKVIEVAGGSKQNGANVQQYESNNTDAQKWIIKKTEDGYYNIISKKSELYLDVAGASKANGANIQQYTGNGTKAQKFTLKECTTLKGEQTIEDGIYKIASALNQNKVLDIAGGSTKNSANVQIFDTDNVSQQRFMVTYIGNGYYTLEALHSGKVIEVAGGSKQNGANVQQYESNNTDAQKWVIKQTEDGYYNIISKKSGLYLDVAGASTANGANVQQYEGNNSKAQKFIFMDPGAELANGTYKIITAMATNKVLDVAGGSTNSRANIQIWKNDNVEQQEFTIKYIGEGYYTITALHSGKVLEVAGGSKQNGANVQQYASNGTDAQKWLIKKTEDGYYNIISKCSGLYLDVAGASTANGSNVQTYEQNGSVAQKFEIKETYFGIDVSKYQAEIDFPKLVASNKVDFMIVRAGYGRESNQKDPYFERNYEQAKKYGIPIGAYLYSYATDVEGAKKEAYNMLEWIKGKSFDLPVFYDIEDASQAGIDKQTQTDMCLAFCEIIQKAGYEAGIYTGKFWIKNYIDTTRIPSDYAIWIASYGSDNNGEIPDDIYKYTGKHDIWQYTSKGSAEGINGSVDWNITYKRY